MFGFQLSNIIPGFPKHTLYFVDPPYELQTSQECENGQVSFQVKVFRFFKEKMLHIKKKKKTTSELHNLQYCISIVYGFNRFPCKKKLPKQY